MLLSSALRHDPDVLMIGEIRDRIGADIAVQAAETGHLVLSSIHAASPYETLLRLVHLGVDPYFLASALRMIIQQRLVLSERPEALCGRIGIFECFNIDPILRRRLMTEPIHTLSDCFEQTLSENDGVT
jgi:Tfp pilus assembly pilus retraction ATPase PilT